MIYLNIFKLEMPFTVDLTRTICGLLKQSFRIFIVIFKLLQYVRLMNMCVCICVLKAVVKDVRVNLYTSVFSLPDTPSKTKSVK